MCSDGPKQPLTDTCGPGRNGPSNIGGTTLSAVRLPGTSDGSANRERRRIERLRLSPGSFFKSRSRELVLAAPYFRDRLVPGGYGGTMEHYYHTLCSASFAMLMSTVEVTWRALFGRIVDATDRYDDELRNLLKDTDMAESVLAHRGDSGAGSVVTAALGTWQAPEAVNTRFQRLLKVQPISKKDIPILRELWQIRHIIAHGAGVTNPLDEYRLGGRVTTDRALQIDAQYLEEAERELLRIVGAAVELVGTRVLRDFFSTPRTFAMDGELFVSLYLLGRVYPHTSELPVVAEPVFLTHQTLATQAATVATVSASTGPAVTAHPPQIGHI